MAEPLTARAREIVVAARELLDEHGPDALTMRRLAERLGIRAPSLYKHLPDKAALEVAVIATGLEDLAVILEEARYAVAEPLAALTAAYRAFARTHPHLYLLMTSRPLPREDLPAGVEERAAAPVLHAAGNRLAPERSGRSPTAWWCWSSPGVSRQTPTSTPHGRPGSMPSSRRTDPVAAGREGVPQRRDSAIRSAGGARTAR